MRCNAGLKLLGALSVGAAAVHVAGRRRDRAIARQVDDLLAAADSTPAGAFSADDLAGLPDPVRRYFETVLDEGQPYVRSVRLAQRGEFRLGGATGSWKPLTAIQHFTVDPPGFVWDTEIRLYPLLSTRIVDAYAAGKGSLRATALGAIPVAEAGPSPELNEGELLRYLAEAVWFPTALLPGQGVTWEVVDDRSARATLTDRGTTGSLVFHFDDENLVKRVRAERRYRAEDDAFVPWTGYFRDYRERNGMAIPTAAEVEWNLPDGDSSYWRATVTDVDHRTGRDGADSEGEHG